MAVSETCGVSRDLQEVPKVGSGIRGGSRKPVLSSRTLTRTEDFVCVLDFVGFSVHIGLVRPSVFSGPMPAGTAVALLAESCAFDNTEGALRTTYHKRSMRGVVTGEFIVLKDALLEKSYDGHAGT